MTARGSSRSDVASSADANEENARVLTRIRGHLRTRGVDALVEMIIDLADRDAALFRRLDMAAAVTGADDDELEKRLCKTIDEATAAPCYLGYREAPGWAAGVDAALDTLAELSMGARAELVVRLAERVIEQVERAIENIDDSDNHCSELLERACEIHLAAARVASPEPVGFAHDLFMLESLSIYGFFHGAVRRYADILGTEGLAAYRRLADEAWQKLAARPDGAGVPDSLDPGRLRDVLDFFAERDGDVDARIALRSKDLSSARNYLTLAEFCLSQGRAEEALSRAEEGLWLFEDKRPDESLHCFAADLLVKVGRSADAEAHLRKAFRKAPSLLLYARVRALGGEAARDWAVEALKARLAKEELTRWSFPADLLIRVLMQEEMFDAAWATVREQGASIDVKRSLAQASEATHPREAIKVYAERVDQLATRGSNPAYAEAAALVAHMAALQSRAEQAAYVMALKVSFGGKRNFMKLLE